MKWITFLFVFAIALKSHSEVVFNWGLSTRLPYYVKVAKEFKEIIEKKTEGRVKINIQIYNDVTDEKGTVEFFKSGKYQIHQMLSGNFIDQAPTLKVWTVPFLFKNEAHLEKYIRSKNAQKVLSQLESDDLYPIDYTFSGGFLYFFGPTHVKTMADLKGKTLSIMYDFGFDKDFLSPHQISTEKINKNQPYDIYGEILGSEVADIISLDAIALDKTKLSLSNHRVISRILFVHKKALNSLQEKDKKVFLKEIKRLAAKEREFSYEGKRLSLALLKNRIDDIYEWTNKDLQRERQTFKDDIEKYKKLIPDEIKFIQKLE